MKSPRPQQTSTAAVQRPARRHCRVRRGRSKKQNLASRVGGQRHWAAPQRASGRLRFAVALPVDGGASRPAADTPLYAMTKAAHRDGPAEAVLIREGTRVSLLSAYTRVEEGVEFATRPQEGTGRRPPSGREPLGAWISHVATAKVLPDERRERVRRGDNFHCRLRHLPQGTTLDSTSVGPGKGWASAAWHGGSRGRLGQETAGRARSGGHSGEGRKDVETDRIMMRRSVAVAKVTYFRLCSTYALGRPAVPIHSATAQGGRRLHPERRPLCPRGPERQSYSPWSEMPSSYIGPKSRWLLLLYHG